MLNKAWLLLLGGLVVLLGFFIYPSSNSYSDLSTLETNHRWYSLQWYGKNVGYVDEGWTRQKQYFQWSQLLHIEGNARGKPFRRVSQEALQFSLDYPYHLLSGSWFVENNQLKQQYDFIVKGDELEISQSGSKKLIPYTVQWNALKLFAPQRESILATEAGGGKTVFLQRWDMQKLTAVDTEFSFGMTDNIGGIQAVSHQQNQIGKKLWNFDASGQLISLSLGESLRLELSSQSEALRLTTADVYQSSLLMVDKPLGDALEIAELELEIGEAWKNLDATDNPSAHQVTQSAPGNFLQIGLPGQFESQRRELFLQHTSRYPDSRRLRRIATSLVTKPKTDFLKAQALVNFVAEYITNDDEINELSVDEILDNASGDCTEHALLFVSLARAAGIPAREVNGLLYLGDEQQKYSAHVWAEVEINGQWLSVDPTWRKMSLDPGYIRIYGDQAANTTTLLALSGKTIFVKNINLLK